MWAVWSCATMDWHYLCATVLAACYLQAQLRSYMTMLLKGVAYLHRNTNMHRYTPAVSLEPLPSAIEGDCSSIWSSRHKLLPHQWKDWSSSSGKLVKVRSFGRFFSFTGIVRMCVCHYLSVRSMGDILLCVECTFPTLWPIELHSCEERDT